MKIRREVLIGAVIVIAIGLLYVGLNYLKGVYVFQKPTEYFAVYDRINGLQPTNPVMVNGYKIGQVKDIEMLSDSGNNLLVTLTINEEIDIPKDSKALLKPGDLFGSMQINIEMGSSNELALSGDTLVPERSGDLFSEVNEQLRPIKIKTKSLLGSIDSVLQVIEAILNTESQENLVQSFRGINQSISNLERATFRIDTLVRDERVRIGNIFKNIEEVSTVLKDNGEDFANVIQNFSMISDTLAKADVAGTIMKANKALTEVDKVVQKINSGEGSLGMLINNPGLYNRLDSAAKNLYYLVEDIRVNPNRYIHFSVFGRKNKSVELTKKELEQLKEYVKSSENE